MKKLHLVFLGSATQASGVVIRELCSPVEPSVAKQSPERFPYDQTGWAFGRAGPALRDWTWELIGAVAYRYIADQPAAFCHFLETLPGRPHQARSTPHLWFIHPSPLR